MPIYRNLGKRTLSGLFLLFYAFVSLYPIVWMLFYSLKNNEEIFVSNPFGFPTHFRYDNYIRAWNSYDILTYFKNSVVITGAVVVGTILLALMFSYSTARMKWKLSEAARMYMLLGMFIPVQIIIVPLVIIIRDLHLTNTYWSLIIPYIAFSLPFSTLVFHAFMRTIPFELEEAAAMDGATIYRAFYSIIAPLLKPVMATMLIFTFLSIWNELFMALILISDEAMKTLPLGLLQFQGQYSTDWGGMGAALVIASIPTILVYLVFSEQIEKAMTVGSAIKG